MIRPTIALLCLLSPTVALAADKIENTVPFEIGTWIPLDLVEGPVTLHRMRLAEVKGPITKASLFRPGNDEFLENIEIQLEYSNSATNDWDATLDVKWVDSDGKVIDGYHDDESLDDGSSRDMTTVKLATLRYGIERAKKLVFSIHVQPD